MAARQHGLITRQQALGLGFTPSKVKSRIRNGSLIRVLPGVYRLRGAPRTWIQDVMSVVMWGGESAVASHGTAARLWRFPVEPSHIEITIDRFRDAPRPHIKIHRSKISATERVNGVPITGAARTLLDIAHRVERDVLESLVDDALSRRLATPSTLEWELRLSGRTGRQGTAAFGRAIAHVTDGHCESPLENKVLRTLLKAGLPPPTRQYSIHDEKGFEARVDFAYPSARLAIEVDGYRYHSGSKSFHNDRKRDARLTAIGWLVIRVSQQSMTDTAFVAAVRKRLGASLF